MTTFWSWYVTLLTLGTISVITWLIFAVRKGQRTDITTDETLEHSIDGIEELDNPLPKWWVLMFIATIVFALLYLVIFPGLGNWKGLRPGYTDGWTQVKQWQKEMDWANAVYGPIFAKYAAMPVIDVAKDADALKIGGRLFATHCSICHGSDAKGNYGFPNLADETWRWGGTPDDILYTLLHGRQGAMPAWSGLGDAAINNLAAYVYSDLGGRTLPANNKFDSAAGKALYASNCVICHGPEGKGNKMLGAPDLTKPAGYIYGTSIAQIEQTLRYGRNGRMPAQLEYLGNDKVHLLAAYVYSLSNPPPKQ